MIFKPPPSGQSCANCLCFDGERCRAHMYPHSAITGDGAPMLGWWCGHWRGNETVRCASCAFFFRPPMLGLLCPRTIVDHLKANVIGGPAPTAPACERWEKPKEDKP